MTASSGSKLKFLNLADKILADTVAATYSIDVTLAISPERQMLCGAITVFKLNGVTDGEENAFTHAMSADAVEEAERQSLQSTESLLYDPILFRKEDGKWIDWAMRRAFGLFHEHGANASLAVKCPKLRVTMRRSAQEVLACMGRYDVLFPRLKEVEMLLESGYSYDPWTGAIRRGRIDASMGGR